MDQAVAIYARIVARNPSQPDALHMFGVALVQSGDALRGADLIERSLRLNPSQPAAYANLGHAELALCRFDAALASYDRSIALYPDYAPAHNGRGSALTALNRSAEGLMSFERAIQILPNFPEALGNRGLALSQRNRFEEAISAFSQSLALRPDDAQMLINRAATLCKLWRYEAAYDDADRALQIWPTSVQARFVRCSALLGLGRHADVVAEPEAVFAGAPYHPDFLVVRGSAHRQLRNFMEATADCEHALRLRSTFPDALLALAILQRELHHHDRALAAFSRLVEVAPDGDFNRGVHLHAKLHLFDWSDYESAVDRILVDADAGKKPDLPFTFLAISDDPQQQRMCARAYDSVRLSPAGPLPRRTRTQRERIRVAYVSADFLEHPMAYLLSGLFETHDRSRFETIAISLRADASSPTQRRLRSAFDRFLDVSGRSDDEIAELIHQLDVDIAVDLMGYTSEERPGIFVRRPAPIQINYIGFPATMGCGYIDYILADRFVIPAATAPFYSERIAYLPECFQANDAQRIAPVGAVTRVEAGLPSDGFVWCAFHASVKINPPLFEVWCRLLHKMPHSILWLISNTASAEVNLRHEAQRRGIDGSRLVFAKRVSYPDHLARLRLGDLCLDTFPFNGGATTSDALWSGVPVVTRAGCAFSSRMSGSLLHTLSLPELVTDNFGDYERVALLLATDRQALASVRTRLLGGLKTSPLFDTDRVTRHIEMAYTMMLERDERGEPAESFLVPADSR